MPKNNNNRTRFGVSRMFKKSGSIGRVFVLKSKGIFKTNDKIFTKLRMPKF